MTAVAVSVFGLTYLLIASRRLRLLPIGRPAGALLGAVLMVALGVLTPTETYAAIDPNTILLLFSTMLLTAYLERAGFFRVLAAWILGACKTARTLLLVTALVPGLLSAFLVNDTVCLFMTPVLVAVCLQGRLPLGPFLIALATSANIGSAATLVGNPQNMIIGSMSRMPFTEFLGRAGLASGIGLAINAALLQVYYARKLSLVKGTPSPSTEPKNNHSQLRLTGLVTLGVVAGFFAGLHLGYTTLAGVLVLVVLDRKDPRETFARVDWPLLVFFCSLFVVVAGLAKTGLIEQAWRAAAPEFNLARPRGLALFTALMTVGSNLISNVPMVLVTGPHLHELGGSASAWVLLAFTTTVAGNLTLVGSVANIIVAETAREHYTLGFVEYLSFGLVSTLLVLAGGVSVIYLQGLG